MIQHRCEGCGLESEVPDRMASQGIQCVRCGRFWRVEQGMTRKVVLAVFVTGALALVIGWLLYYRK